jgi:hypothetical protein
MVVLLADLWCNTYDLTIYLGSFTADVFAPGTRIPAACKPIDLNASCARSSNLRHERTHGRSESVQFWILRILRHKVADTKWQSQSGQRKQLLQVPDT